MNFNSNARWDDITLDDAKLQELTSVIGNLLKNRRLIVGLTQRQLGHTINVSPQQIQKYENATNRVSASTLFVFAKRLNVDISYFYQNLSIDLPNSPVINRNIYDKPSEPIYNLGESAQQELIYNVGAKEELSDREVIQIVVAYKNIKDPEARKQVLKIAELMAK